MDRVLLIRLSSLGDVVLTTPVAANLKRAGAAVHVLTRGAFAPVFAGDPNVDEVLMYEERGLWGWAREIRRRRYDAVLDLHDTPRSRLWTALSGAPRRGRYDKRAWARRRLVWTKRSSSDLAGNTVDRYLEPLAAWGVAVVDRTPRLRSVPGETLSDDLERRLGAGPRVAVAPGALHETKRWPPDRFARAADQLAKRWGEGAGILLLGASGDRPAVEAVLRHLEGPAQSLAGQTSLREMIQVLARCAVLLTNDSGAMHVGAALGIPTVAIFGPTVREFGFFPTGPRVAVAQGGPLPCRPCSLHGTRRCPEGHFRCMADVEVDRVVALAENLLEAGTGA